VKDICHAPAADALTNLVFAAQCGHVRTTRKSLGENAESLWLPF
jgi:hypothetical protein